MATRDHLGRSAGRLGEDIAALGGAAGGGIPAPVEDGQRLTGQAQPGRAVPVPEDGRPGHGGLVGVGRADDVEVGDRAQRARCSMGWWVRAVLTEPDRSCVQTKVTGSFCRAARRAEARM